MNDCLNVDVRERLPDLLHDALSTGLRAGVLAHVAQCEDCAAELDVLQRARAVMARAPEVDVDRIAAALPAPPRRAPLAVSRGGVARAAPPPSTLRAAGTWRRWASAAGLVLAVGAAGVTWQQLDGERAADPATPLGADARASGAAGDAVDPTQLLAVNVVGLSEEEITGLLHELDDLEAIPLSEPLPAVPLPPGVEPGGGE